jgi:hypothetical protein
MRVLNPWTTAISVGVLWLLILFALPETLRCRVGNGSLHARTGPLLLPPRITSPLAAESERGPAPPKPSLANLWQLFCNPPISISSLYTALLFATYFSMAVDLPVVLTSQYGWSVTAVGGGYLALGLAIILGSVTGGRYSDWRRARAVQASPDGTVLPQNRLVDQIWGTLLCAAGSIMYGWLVGKNVHPAAVLVATFLSTWSCEMQMIIGVAPLTGAISRLRHVVGAGRDLCLRDRDCPSGPRRCHGGGESDEKPGCGYFCRRCPGIDG